MNNENATDDVIIDQNTTDSVTIDAGNESDASSASQTQSVNDVDDRGVSYKNRFFELERKYDNLIKSTPQMIQEAAQLAAQQVKVQQQPEYSVNDFLTAKMRDPQNAAYYDAQIIELQKKEISATVKQELNQFRRQSEEQIVKSQAEAWAVNNFPQLNDPNNAYTQEVWRQFNSRSVDKREPQDFAIAAELVANRMGIKPAQMNKQQDVVVQKDRQIKKLIKERALEGDGRGNISIPQTGQKQADLKHALESGQIRGYLEKYWLKPVQAE